VIVVAVVFFAEPFARKLGATTAQG